MSARSTIIRDATVLTMDPADAFAVKQCDLLVEGARISAIGLQLEAPPGATVIDGSGKLVMPGLINAHTHSSETFLKGRYENMPLETWMLYAYPLVAGESLPPRLIYLRSLLLAMQSLRAGVTTLCDDFFDPPEHDLGRLGEAFAAYADAGIRANVSSAVINISMLEALPFARQVFPPDLQNKLAFGPAISARDYIDFCESAMREFHGRCGRLGFMINPSAPQRCTPELLVACDDLARRKQVPFHTHALETIVQAVTGPQLYGKSLIAYMHDLGVLNSHTTLAHAVWASDADIDLMVASGCSVVHNTISNLKLGAGIAPVRRLIDAGVPLGLGTDGLSSNDTARIFDVMRVAALIQSAASSDPKHWLTAQSVLEAATLGGARSAMLAHETGSLEVGKAADLLMLDLSSDAFTPLNDIAKHLVYAENGSSISLVMVNGNVVVEDGHLKTVDEAEILTEIREAMPAFLAQHGEYEALSAVYRPYMEEIQRRSSEHGIKLRRSASNTPV